MGSIEKFGLSCYYALPVGLVRNSRTPLKTATFAEKLMHQSHLCIRLVRFTHCGFARSYPCREMLHFPDSDALNYYATQMYRRFWPPIISKVSRGDIGRACGSPNIRWHSRSLVVGWHCTFSSGCQHDKAGVQIEHRLLGNVGAPKKMFGKRDACTILHHRENN